MKDAPVPLRPFMSFLRRYYILFIALAMMLLFWSWLDKSLGLVGLVQSAVFTVFCFESGICRRLSTDGSSPARSALLLLGAAALVWGANVWARRNGGHAFPSNLGFLGAASLCFAGLTYFCNRAVDWFNRRSRAELPALDKEVARWLLFVPVMAVVPLLGVLATGDLERWSHERATPAPEAVAPPAQG